MRAAALAREVARIVPALPLFAASPLLRHWHLHWGATDEEVAAPMAGDGLVPGPSFSATRAITIDAPPAIVWSWLVQAGFGRGGFYSYDLFDNAGRPSATRILPELQHAAIGDRVPMTGKATPTTAFRVAAVDPPRTLLWVKPHSTWSWQLTPIAGGRATRLVTRLKDRYPWRSSPGSALLSTILLEHGDFPMMRRMLLGLRARAERDAEEADGA